MTHRVSVDTIVTGFFLYIVGVVREWLTRYQIKCSLQSIQQQPFILERRTLRPVASLSGIG